MYTAADLRKGLRIEWEGVPYLITEFEFMKPGKGQAIYTCRLKNMLNGATMVKTFRSVDKIGKPDLAHKDLHFSYADRDNSVFMDDNYEEVVISAEVLGDSRFFLSEDLPVTVMFYQGRPVDVTLPTFVEREIVQTEPGYRGNTATNLMKPACVEGGYEIQVPLFLNVGDVIKIDTRTGEYADRVSKK